MVMAMQTSKSVKPEKDRLALSGLTCRRAETQDFTFGSVVSPDWGWE
jgi:hypothetical protein